MIFVLLVAYLWSVGLFPAASFLHMIAEDKAVMVPRSIDRPITLVLLWPITVPPMLAWAAVCTWWR
jgi:hypothetical protein